jgi:hypothetical protein
MAVTPHTQECREGLIKPQAPIQESRKNLYAGRKARRRR